MKKKFYFKFLSLVSLSAFSLVFITSCSSNSLFGIYPNNINPPSNSTPPSTNHPSTNPPILPSNPSDPDFLTKIDQFDYSYNSSRKFSNPLYQNGKIVGIDLPNGGANPTSPGEGITQRANLLTKKLPNQTYVDLAKRSYSIEIVNGAPLTGTTWILDYQLTNDNTYPTTWYFGSNAHVLDDLRIKNNTAYPYNFAEWVNGKFPGNNTSKLNLIGIKNPNVNDTFENYNGWSTNNPNWKKASVDLTTPNPNGQPGEWEGYFSNNKTVKTIFMGNDFLEKDPKDYLDSTFNQGSKYNRWYSNKEYADFGVIEVKFPTPEIAKDITNDYASLPENKKFKYKQTDLIHNYERKEQYITSFPIVGLAGNVKELTVNKQKIDYDNGDRKGGELGTSPYYSTFKSKPSIFDVGIGLSFFGANLERFNNVTLTNDFDHYNSWGLMYQLNYGNVNPGASGSLVMDEDGYSLGVLWGSDQNASAGLLQSFYSNGFSYSGYYGKYELPAYDLIRGGKPGQKKSYYDGLVSFYGNDNNFKTNLFPNGLKSRY